jgi:hypothetical protein
MLSYLVTDKFSNWKHNYVLLKFRKKWSKFGEIIKLGFHPKSTELFPRPRSEKENIGVR